MTDNDPIQVDQTTKSKRPHLAPEGIDPILLASEISAWLRIAEATLWRWIAEGSFPKGFKLGRATRWHKSSVDEWLATQAEQAA